MRTFASATACLLIIASMGIAANAAPPKADNTAQNKGATQPDAVNADKQAKHNTKSDVKVLAAVRESIMAEKELSTDAKNCKLDYSKDSGCLILRGAVDSETEKTKVGELATACAGVTSVKNELTVAAKAH